MVVPLLGMKSLPNSIRVQAQRWNPEKLCQAIQQAKSFVIEFYDVN